MFALRNIGSQDAVLELAKGLDCEDNDKGMDQALFRHEIAYVFGQMQHPAAVPSLIKRLKRTDESPMVRHECAEALGSIATDECWHVLKQFATDEVQVVRESCQVALDMYEFERSGKFQYAMKAEMLDDVKDEQ